MVVILSRLSTSYEVKLMPLERLVVSNRFCQYPAPAVDAYYIMLALDYGQLILVAIEDLV